MASMISYLAKFRESFPSWLHEEDYSLRHFFTSRTVFYPGSGKDGHPLAVFNASWSTHCFFFVDQNYSTANLLGQLGNLPTGYVSVFEKHYSSADLQREAHSHLSEVDLGQFTVAPTCDGPRDYKHPPRSGMRSPADTESAARLLIYERSAEYGEDHGAQRFAAFCLGMEARAAYEWFYGEMFKPCSPFAILLQDHGTGLDCAKSHPRCGDDGFGDPDGALYRAAKRSGLPEFLLQADTTKCWRGYVPAPGVESHRGGVTAGFDRWLFKRKGVGS